MKKTIVAALAAAALSASTVAFAETTPWGAEAGGNADGTIAAWTGLSEPTLIDGVFVNPFAGDGELFRIDQSNLSQHRDKLSAGQIAMIERHDSYFIPVYPTRRAYSVPDGVIRDAQAEASGVSMNESGSGVVGLNKSLIPFPEPTAGVQLVWNHILRFQGGTYIRGYAQAPVQSNGAYTLQRLRDFIAFRPKLLENPEENGNVLLKFIQVILAPPRLEGNVLLVHDTLDQLEEPRAAWVYNAGQRRVRRAPNIAYDGPGTAAEGMRTTDDFGMFNGSPDKYDWALKGKREMYVPVNSFSLASSDLSYEDVIGEKHLNQEHTRYELRRVWEVEGTLKSGERHIYGKRVFYLDEDGSAIVLADQFDNRGELWRVKEGHSAIDTARQARVYVGEPIYDLQAGRYLILGLVNEERPQFEFGVDLDDSDFTPSALRRRGRK